MAVSKKIIRLDSLSTDRVWGTFDDDLLVCPICSNVLWKPITCRTCENSFCLKCLRLWFKERENHCPFNCSFVERKPPAILLKLLAKLKLSCSYQSNGCSLFIPYEALEKHQEQLCEYRPVECSHCFEQMLSQDLNEHLEEKCLAVQLTCYRCQTIYSKKDGHDHIQCLDQQLNQTKEMLNASDGKSPILQSYFHKMTQAHRREKFNQTYANRISLDLIPSAPIEDIPSAPSDEEASSTISTEDNNIPLSNESLRISTVDFNQIRRGAKEGGLVANGYAAFNWENVYYIWKDYVLGNFHLRGFQSGFTNDRICLAYNGNSKPMIISLPNDQRRFSIHSFECMSVYYKDLSLTITAYRSNVLFNTKTILLSNEKSILVEIDWMSLNKLVLTPSVIHKGTKPHTFALISINFLL